MDVYLLALSNYSHHLQDLEQRDLKALQKQLATMRHLRADLLQDLDFEDLREKAMLNEKHEVWDQVDERVVELRNECLLLIQEIEETKGEYAGEQEEEAVSCNGESERGDYAQYMTKAEKKLIAQEVY